MWRKTAWSPNKSGRAWSDFWFLLISSGFEFAKNDLINLRKWCSEDLYRHWHSPGEGHYAVAVRDGNISFAAAYEVYMKRKPFICSGIDYGYCHSQDYIQQRTQPKTHGRLVIGAWFKWQGEKVKVTAFKDEKQSLIACAYHPSEEVGYEPSKIRRRFCISIKELGQSKKQKK